MKKRTKKLLPFALVFAARSVAWADIPESTALLVDGDHTRFKMMVDGIPIGSPEARPLAGAAFFIDSLLHAGDNDVTVIATSDSAFATMQLTLTAPGGARLGHAQCGFAQPDGTTPACQRHAIFHFTIHLTQAPDFALWHARPATPSATAIAASLAAEQAALTEAARAGDWSTLFFGHDPRRADLLAAGAGMRAQAAEMARHMQDAARAHPGTIGQASPPVAGDLVLTALPGNLVAVSRRNDAPVLRVQVGSGQTQDPEDFGDVSDRYLDGIYQQMIAIYGFEAGAWQRLR